MARSRVADALAELDQVLALRNPSHAKLTKALRRVGQAAGWWVFAPPRSAPRPGQFYTMGGAGMTDLLFIKVPRVVFVEVKVGRDQLRPAQRKVLSRVQDCTEVYGWVIRPEEAAGLATEVLCAGLPPSPPMPEQGTLL